MTTEFEEERRRKKSFKEKIKEAIIENIPELTWVGGGLILLGIFAAKNTKKIRQADYDAGYQEGGTDGYNQGYSDGYTQGSYNEKMEAAFYSKHLLGRLNNK